MSKKSNIKLKDYLSDDGKLDLSILQLKAVPNINDILALRNVKSIDLSNNQIESLPDDFIKLEGIQTLYLSKNHLTSLPENFGQLKSLKQLDLYGNQITNLPLSFVELTRLEHLDLKDNPLEDDLQAQAGKCLNKKECALCAKKVLQYMNQRKDEFEKEQAAKLKKKMANEKAKAKKREKQAEKEREEKRLKRIEEKQKRKLEYEQTKQNQSHEEDHEQSDDNESLGNTLILQDQSDGWLSQIIDGILQGLFLSLVMFFCLEMYRNRQNSIDLRDFYKHV